MKATNVSRLSQLARAALELLFQNQPQIAAKPLRGQAIWRAGLPYENHMEARWVSDRGFYAFNRS